MMSNTPHQHKVRIDSSILTFPMVRVKGFQPPTLGSEDRCSMQLSYTRIYVYTTFLEARCLLGAKRNISLIYNLKKSLNLFTFWWYKMVRPIVPKTIVLSITPQEHCFKNILILTYKNLLCQQMKKRSDYLRFSFIQLLHFLPNF